MTRVLAAGFVLGVAILGAGLLLVLGSAIAAGDWWLARQPWIGLGLNATVIGLAIVHITAPALVFAVLGRSSTRGMAVIGFLVVGVVVSVGLAQLRAATIELLLGTFIAWAVIAVLITAWQRDARSWLVSALAVPVTGLSAVVVSAWWLFAAVGFLTRSRVPGAPPPPPPNLIEDAGTLIYSRPDLALILPGLPTLLLLLLASLVVALPWLTRDRSSVATSASQPVLT